MAKARKIRQKPSPDFLRELAAQCARDLFLSGSGRGLARRLVMEMSGEHFNGGGWCEDAVRDRILDVLRSRVELA